MTCALIVLPRSVDDDGDATEILKAADVDRSRWLIATVLNPDTGHIVDEVADRTGLAAFDLP